MDQPQRKKKELRAAYEQMVRKAGVYRVLNRVNGKCFFDITSDLASEWKAQQFQLKLGGHPNEELQREWNALGAEAFAYETFTELGPVDTQKDARKELRTLLAMVLEEQQPYGEKGYNTRPPTVKRA